MNLKFGKIIRRIARTIKEKPHLAPCNGGLNREKKAGPRLWAKRSEMPYFK
jgi:hypothetical protein